MGALKSLAAVSVVAGGLVAVPAAALPAANAAVIVHGVRAAVPVAAGRAGAARATWSASNWSGYAETGTFAGVSGTWTVPSVSASTTSTYSSAWIGVDGFNDDDLIQTGTEEDYYSGAAHYDAWWEILPAAETEISTAQYPVAAGDRMSAKIYKTTTTTTTGRHGRQSSSTEWMISLSDTTKGWSFSTTQAYTGPGSSAEWILEAPEVNGSIASLAHYQVTPPANTGDFDNAGVLTSAVASGSPTYTPAALTYSDSGVMVQKNVQVSTPGDPDSAATAFNVAYGSAVPATPNG